MRINKYLAEGLGISRRKADDIIIAGRVSIDSKQAVLGDKVVVGSTVKLDGRAVIPTKKYTTIMLNKPVGYVCSRDGQGSSTIYDLFPENYHNLKPVGRLDKDSSGLLLLTNDGDLAHRLTHPSYEKNKVYNIKLDKKLSDNDKKKIEEGVVLEDGISKLSLEGKDHKWTITMHEGRNRQIRRTFSSLGYEVLGLHRTQIGQYKNDDLDIAKFRIL